jgi:hypothetical protein
MKRFSKILFTALTVTVMTVLACVAANAEITSFSVNGYSDKNTSFTVRWQDYSDGIYNLYVPSTADSELTVHYVADGRITVNGTVIADGQQTGVFADEGTYTLTDASGSVTLNIYRMTLPTVFIATSGKSTPDGMTTLEWLKLSKENKDKDGTIAIVDNDEDKTVQYSGKLSQIKGRGNSTWDYDKRPFNIKLDKKAKIFDMEKNKSWCLLANYLDHSLVRNTLAYNMGNEMGIEYTTTQTSVNFYIDGEYQGVYNICEKVEINDGRIEITDLEEANEEANPDIDIEECARNCSNGNINSNTAGFYKWVDIPNDPEDITGGYVLETELEERFKYEVSGFVTDRGVCVVIKSPEYASKAEVEYIRDVYQKFEDAVYNKYGSNGTDYYTDLVDMDSMVKMYIANDFLLGLDSSVTSFYFTKDADKRDENGNVTEKSKLVAAPLWDFDNSLGNTVLSESRTIGTKTYRFDDPNSTWIRDGLYHLPDRTTIPHMLHRLYDHKDFEEAVNEYWQANHEELIGNMLTLSTQLQDTLSHDSIVDGIKWNSFKTKDTAGVTEKRAEEFNSLRSFITERDAFLTQYYTEDNSESVAGGTFVERVIALLKPILEKIMEMLKKLARSKEQLAISN